MFNCLRQHFRFKKLTLVLYLLQKSSTILRYWIMLSLIETVIVFATSLGGSIYFAQFLDIYYGIPLIAIQVIVASKCQKNLLLFKYSRVSIIQPVDNPAFIQGAKICDFAKFTIWDEIPEILQSFHHLLLLKINLNYGLFYKTVILGTIIIKVLLYYFMIGYHK